MITTDGKNIIAKYLLNQAPEFASHIAIGVGGNAALISSSVTFSPSAQALNFEVARVPITSKGLIKENGIEKIVLKAELPTDQRYQITELGLYPDESNLLAEKYDSKILASFTNAEQWVHWKDGSSTSVVNHGEVDVDTSGNIIHGSVSSSSAVLFINSDSQLFEFDLRKARNEPPRYLSKSMMFLGSTASMDASYNTSANSTYIENSFFRADLSNNLPEDEIKIAFSVLSRDTVTDASPSYVRIKLTFLNSGVGTPSASAGISVNSSTLYGERYQVASIPLSSFYKDTNFSWTNISNVRIYVAVEDTNPEDYFVVLDGLKLDNISTSNPLYALVAADYMKTSDAYPALKKENSISYIEYRFGIGT